MSPWLFRRFIRRLGGMRHTAAVVFRSGRRNSVVRDQTCLLSRLLVLPLLVASVIPDNRANPADELCSAVASEG
ncbi:MAG: hypothetical protein DWH79_08655 [Planctomycetota bacterium]|nr:MAG: hypothetical protein DWH79_08655 [Planctomycetota bacterium]